MEYKTSINHPSEKRWRFYMWRTARTTTLFRRLASWVQAANQRPLSSRHQQREEENSVRNGMRPTMEPISISTHQTIRTRSLRTREIFRTLAEHRTSVWMSGWIFPSINSGNGADLGNKWSILWRQLFFWLWLYLWSMRIDSHCRTCLPCCCNGVDTIYRQVRVPLPPYLDFFKFGRRAPINQPINQERIQKMKYRVLSELTIFSTGPSKKGGRGVAKPFPSQFISTPHATIPALCLPEAGQLLTFSSPPTYSLLGCLVLLLLRWLLKLAAALFLTLRTNENLDQALCKG